MSRRVEHLLDPPSPGTDAERTTEVVQDDRRIGKRARKFDEIVKLVVVQPRFEGQAKPVEVRETSAERRVREHAGRGGLRAHRGIRVPDAVADATEPAARYIELACTKTVCRTLFP